MALCVLHGVPALVGGDGGRGDAGRRDAVAQVDGHRLRVEVVGQVAADMRHLDVVDVVVSQHLSATSAPVSPPGNWTLEYLRNTDCRRACSRVTGDADHDDQYVHSDHGCGVVDS